MTARYQCNGRRAVHCQTGKAAPAYPQHTEKTGSEGRFRCTVARSPVSCKFCLIRLPVFAFILFVQETSAIAAFAFAYGFTFLITAPLTVVFAGNLFGPSRLGAFVGAVVFDRWESYDGAFALMAALAVVAKVATLSLQRGKLRPT